MQEYIKLVNVGVAYGSKQVLQDINLTLHKGECVALLGPSGSGKSTILRLIIGLQAQTTGQIYLKNRAVSSYTKAELEQLRTQMGMVFQYSALFDFLNVKENIAFGLRQHTKLSEKQIEARVIELLKLVGLEDMGSLMPNELSGGMKKRVSLARAIATSPEILLYDEPTAGLDPIMAGTINRLMVKVQKDLQTTSIVVTHDIESALMVADRIILLHDGKIVVDSPKNKVFAVDNLILQEFIYGWDEMRVLRSKERLEHEVYR
ncbi:ABC transporter ATP-binding protein [Succinispira mobilis]|uniref:ABC transporter ATP-binding protein n=1 Tax=Succinispira mobilis TaxID=78120 RepID=UPI00037B6583|nr:ATP-binding cassette domain-containing protein [Succinispira mobilis]